MPLPDSLWAQTASRAPRIGPVSENISADVLVIGGGYTGLSTGLHLAQKGTEVVVLEADEVGFGGSGRNMGQVNTGFKVLPDNVERRVGRTLGERMNHTFARAADLVFDLIDEYQIDCDAKRNGNIFLAHNQRSIALIEAYQEQHRKWGGDVRWLNREAVRSALGSPRYIAGVLDARCGTLQPLSYARGLARTAQACGARVYSRSRVAMMKPGHRDWTATTDGNHSVEATKVVIATDAYSDELLPGLNRTLIPVTVQQVATTPLGENVGRTILDGGHGTSDRMHFTHYFCKDRDGRLLMVTGGGKPPSVALMKHYFPQLGNIAFEYQWSGMVGLSPTQLPRLHRPAPDLIAVMGYSGRGLTTATMIGKLLAQHLTGELEERDLPLPMVSLQPHAAHRLKTIAMSGTIGAARWLDALGFGW
ncbi:MAG TPA: FAD-binding oxidoreductase [Acidobacteria bacterium]|nr:FAD-binding oxidoreductase [Acidobacteriota bacterium]